MAITKLLSSSNFLAINKTLIHAIGLHETIIFSELCSRYEYHEAKDELTEDGYFFCTADKLLKETSLTERQQREPLKRLKELGFIQSKLKGNPAKMHYKIDANNEASVFKFLQNVKTSLADGANKFLQNVETRLDELSKLDLTKCKNTYKKNNNIKKIKNNNKSKLSREKEKSFTLEAKQDLDVSFSAAAAESPKLVIVPSPDDLDDTDLHKASESDFIHDAFEIADATMNLITEERIEKYKINYKIFGFDEKNMSAYILATASQYMQSQNIEKILRGNLGVIEKAFCRYANFIIKKVNDGAAKTQAQQPVKKVQVETQTRDLSLLAKQVKEKWRQQTAQ